MSKNLRLAMHPSELRAAERCAAERRAAEAPRATTLRAANGFAAGLDKLVDTSSGIDPVEERNALYERKYDVEHLEVMTIAELIKVVAELNAWR